MPTAAINQHGCRVSLKSERLEVFGRNLRGYEVEAVQKRLGATG
jgi:hypothetical protein